MTVFFISDLHLSAERDDLTASFKSFLRNEVIPEAKTLYILGDLFEYWIGADLANPFIDEIAASLLELSEAHGIKTYFMPGNRDFLIDNKFCQRCGMELLSDPSCVTIDQQQVLLMHGDSLCTQDKWYQRYRRLARHPLTRFLFLASPRKLRQLIADKLRQQSKQMTAGKSHQVLDVDDGAVRQVMAKHQVNILIHGHTHRPAVHTWIDDGKRCKRIVLGDWGRHNWVLRTNEKGMQLVSANVEELEHAAAVVTD